MVIDYMFWFVWSLLFSINQAQNEVDGWKDIYDSGDPLNATGLGDENPAYQHGAPFRHLIDFYRCLYLSALVYCNNGALRS